MSTISNTFGGEVNILTPPIKTILLYPDKDALLLQSEEYVNYGDSNLMQATNSTTSNAAVIMNFSGINSLDAKVWDNLVDINLHTAISGYRTKSHIINTYAYNNDDWIEYFVAWANAPVKGDKLFDFSVEPKTTSVNTDVTELVKARKSAGNIGFYFNSFDEPESRIVSICSKESTSKPALIIRYYDIPGAPYQKTLKGSMFVRSLVFNENHPYTAGYGELNGSLDIKPIYEYIDMNGSMYIPKYVAVHEVFKNENGDITGENQNTTEVTDRYVQSETDRGNWDTEITGTVTVKKNTPMAMITGSVTPWKGSAFVLTFKKANESIIYSGDEIAQIAEAEANTSVTTTSSVGDLITGTINAIGKQSVELTGTVDIAQPSVTEMSGTLSICNPVFTIVTNEDGSTTSPGDFLTCSNTIVYKEDGKTIDEEKSCYLKVDGHVGGKGDGVDQISGELKVPKFFTTGTVYYNLGATVFSEVVGTDATEPANVFNPSTEIDSTTGSVEVTCPKATLVFNKYVNGNTNYTSVNEEATGTYMYIIGNPPSAEMTGSVTVALDANVDANITGSSTIAAIVFPKTTNEDGSVTCAGDLLTGTVLIQSNFSTELTGEVRVSDIIPAPTELPGTIDIAVNNTTWLDGNVDVRPTVISDINGNVDVSVKTDYVELSGTVRMAFDIANLPELTGSISIITKVFPETNNEDGSVTCAGDLLTCLSNNIVYVKDEKGNNTTTIDDAKSGPYLRVKALSGIITGIDADGKTVYNPSDYENIVFSIFSKPMQELTGDTNIAAKLTTWLNGTITVDGTVITEMDGNMNINAVLSKEMSGTVTVYISNTSYAFIM